MSISLAGGSFSKFQFVHQGDRASDPVQQLNALQSNGSYSDSNLGADPGALLSNLKKYVVIFDDSAKRCNVELNQAQDPFVSGEKDDRNSSPAISAPQIAQRPTLYHSFGMWNKSKKTWCSRVDMRPLYYQHFLNLKRISDYQFDCLTSFLAKAKRESRVEDCIQLSIFLHESSGLRSAIDSDVDLFRTWYSGGYKGSLRKKFSSERMLFKGYVDQLNDHWKNLTSEELFELPIIKILSRTPVEIVQHPVNRTAKNINQRTYFNTLVHHVDNRDRGHTLY